MQQDMEMDTLCIYGLWLLLSLPTVNAIWCLQCNRATATKSCPVRNELCWASADAACFTLKFHIGKKVVLSERGCMQDCSDLQNGVYSLWHQIACCYTDYCNQ